MEKKNKDRKNSSVTSQEANESNEPLRKEDQNHSGVGLASEKNAAISSSSHDNAPSLNQQFQPFDQWPHTTQSTMEQSPILISNPSLSLHQHQHQHQQPSPDTHQVQHGHPPAHLAQPAMPFLPPQRSSYQLSGVNGYASFQPFGPIGTTDTWQGHYMTGGATSPRNQTQIPSFCYHANYPYPGIPGSWDQASWWSQAQPSIPPFIYNFPGPCGFISSLPPPMPGCSAAASQFFLRGVIQPSEKLSQKHQKLWEAQSAENVQLWALVGQLQTELANCKSRLLKLESEVFSQKPIVEQPTAPGIGISLAGQSSKRGRPKKPISPADGLPTPNESRPRARGRKPAMSIVQSGTKETSFRKKSLKKVVQKENPCHSTVQHPNSGNIVNISGNGYRESEISETNPLFHNQIHQGAQGNKNGDSKTFFDVVTDLEGVEPTSASANIVGRINNENIRWNSNTQSEGYYDDPGTIGEGRDVVVRWNEDDEMEDDDDSSDTEEDIS
ncbi:hypothetical protein Acr_01g0008940 [Actinidia rufa]|uniref:Uncharacterized protein n=1 Tax=Actinidia rufa TaxID=165716 RepID=A0A7J0E3Z0_9ERIC|nr:hypothetical protein Acr_01g0008940 [Actinidia rufa]